MADPATDGLATRWTRLWRQLGAPAVPDFAALAASYGEAHRHYHTLEHIGECLAAYDAQVVRDPAVELALWFHDAVYDPRRHDNEELSAALFRTTALAAGGLDDALQGAVADAILATRHRVVPADSRGRLVVDLDLGVLGADRPRYERYEGDIRKEYAWVPWPDYARGRAALMRAFLARTQLYSTPALRARWEAAARVNVAWTLERLATGPDSLTPS